ncbi:unnamed protein product [Caretta caretta]
MPEPDKEEKEMTRDDMFNVILSVSTTQDHEQRAWRVNTADSLEKERVDRRKVQESKQEKGGDAPGHNEASPAVNADGSSLLWTYKFNKHGFTSLCSPWRTPLQHLPTLPQHSMWHQGLHTYLYKYSPGDIKDKHLHIH